MNDPLPTHVLVRHVKRLGKCVPVKPGLGACVWTVVNRWKRNSTAREVVRVVISNVELDVLMRFWSNNGPKFDAGIFRDEWNDGASQEAIRHHITIQGNEHAEVVVKAVKELVEDVRGWGFR